jgi:hypothetical protein
MPIAYLTDREIRHRFLQFQAFQAQGGISSCGNAIQRYVSLARDPRPHARRYWDHRGRPSACAATAAFSAAASTVPVFASELRSKIQSQSRRESVGVERAAIGTSSSGGTCQARGRYRRSSLSGCTHLLGAVRSITGGTMQERIRPDPKIVHPKISQHTE